VGLALLRTLGANAQSPVLQRGYDGSVSGATLTETALNTSNVVPGSFGLVFRLAVDDNIMAQPLYVPHVTINGRTHRVLYVATMSDSLYAFDADFGGAPLWKINLATAVGATPPWLTGAPAGQMDFAYSGNKSIAGHLGILSTPVIDLSSNTLYAVACTLENQTLVYRLHAVDITSGALRAGSGVVISGVYGTMTFDARTELQRVSPVLSGNNVVFAFAALQLESTANLYSGWVMAYDKSTLAQSGIFATITRGNGGGGVWQSGRPPAVDTSGYIYLLTGNGYGGTGYDGVHNFSESVLKLDPAHGLALLDWFTPGLAPANDWQYLDLHDLDLSSSGPMLIPGTGLLTAGGKTGVLYVLNTANLGKNTTTDSGAVQRIQLSILELRGGPVYWARSTAHGGPLLYDWGANDTLKAYSYNGSSGCAHQPPDCLSASSHGTANQAWPGGILTLSANGSAAGTGVLWATVATSTGAENSPPVPGALYAFDASNVATQLWNSNIDAARDALGNFAKFVPPLVASGRVYVATWSQQVAVYGVLPPTVASVSPTTGPTTGGTPVTIAGTNFAGGSRVTFGGAAATSVLRVSATEIKADTPPHNAGSVSIVVISPNGQKGTLASGFTYAAP
jgi:hypothetical protein